jgi:lipoprotein NlpI
MNTRLPLPLLVAFFLTCLLPASVRCETAKEIRSQARAAWKAGQAEKALKLADRAIALSPKEADGQLLRGQLLEALFRHDAAVEAFTRSLELNPKSAAAYDHRGSEQFKRGKIAESLRDFDRALKLEPSAGPGHWKRGITLYYLGKYDEGRKQFKGYEKVDTNDVENAVWHFLCAVRAENLAKARASMLKIGRDARVPMMRVYDLYRGSCKPADVLAAAEAGKPTDAERKQRLFYAHLYLGLNYDVTGNARKALEHMTLAAEKYRIPHYMGDVARVHLDLLRKQNQKK